MKRFIGIFLALILLTGTAQASVALNGSVSALIGKDGETLIAPHTYSSIVKLSDSLFAACSQENGKFALIDETGEALTEFEYGEFRMLENGIMFLKNGKYGVMDFSFETLIPAEYTWLIENGEGGYLALRTDVWDDSPDGVYKIDETGYLSPTGVKVASFLIDFRNGLSPALSTDNGRYGYLNSDGQWKIRPQYAYADEFTGGIAVASMDSGSGVIDEKGSWLITPKYDFISIAEGESTLISAVSYEEGVTVFSGESFEKMWSMDEESYGAYVSVGASSVIAYLADRVVQVGSDGREIVSVDENGYVFPVCESYTIVYDESGAHLFSADGKKLLSGYKELDHLYEENGRNYFLFTDAASEMQVGVLDKRETCFSNAGMIT